MNGKIEAIPSISVFDGAPVVAGKDGYGKVDADLFDLVEDLRKGSKRLYMIDLNGIHQNNPQTDLILELSSDMEIWVDAGPRVMEDLMDIITSGAAKAVIGTKTLLSLDEFRRCMEITENIIFSIDIMKDSVAAISREIGSRSISEILNEVKESPMLQVYWMNRGRYAGNSLNTTPFFEILSHIKHPALYAANVHRSEVEQLPDGVSGAVFRYDVSQPAAGRE